MGVGVWGAGCRVPVLRLSLKLFSKKTKVFGYKAELLWSMLNVSQMPVRLKVVPRWDPCLVEPSGRSLGDWGKTKESQRRLWDSGSFFLFASWLLR